MMTSLSLLAIGTGGAGFIAGALLVHWAYKPVKFVPGLTDHPALPLGSLPAVDLAIDFDHDTATRTWIRNPEYKVSENDCR